MKYNYASILVQTQPVPDRTTRAAPPPTSPRASAKASRDGRTRTPTLTHTPSDLAAVSRPDVAQRLRRCICHEILSTCLCREKTRTKDGVCDLCLYGIHVEEEGQRKFHTPTQGASYLITSLLFFSPSFFFPFPSPGSNS